MAAIDCPHCGKEMYEGLDTCPHCGGPITAEIIEAANQEILRDIEEASKGASRKYLIWFIASTLIGFIGAIFFARSFVADMGIGPTILVCVFMIYDIAAMIYGFYCFKPFRRWNLIVFLFMVGIIAAVYVGMFGGMFFWYPRAIIRLIRRKPLVSDKEVLNLAERGWL